MEASRVREQLNNDETVMDVNNPTEEEEMRAQNAAHEAFLAVDFLAKSDMKRFGSLLAELENSYTHGVDGHPVTLASSFDMVVNYRDPSKYRALTCNVNEDGMSFFNDQGELHDQPVPQDGGCSGCGAMGRGGHRGRGRGNGSGWGQGQHSTQGSNFYQALGDNKDDHDSRPGQIEDNSNEQSDPCSHHVKSHVHYSPSKPFDTETPERWLMLDSCSTLNLISNKSWLLDLHEVDTAMHIHSTRGVSVTCKMGYLGNYPTPVWYLAGGHVNILSLRDVTRHYRVTMDTAVENALILHGNNGQQHKFTPLGKGLYKWEHTMDPTEDNPCWLFVTTVCRQGDHYTRCTYERAQAARRLQNIIMRPASHHMSNVAISHLRNCPVTKEDVWAADDIFGPNLGSLKGKTVWRPNKHVQAGSSAVPRRILEIHRNVVLSTDIMFVNKIPFLVTSSCNICFSTVESLPNRQVGTVATCLKKVTRLYHHQGFG